MKPLYKVLLEDGQEFQVYADNEKEAWSSAVHIWPFLLHKDVRDVIQIKPG